MINPREAYHILSLYEGNAMESGHYTRAWSKDASLVVTYADRATVSFKYFWNGREIEKHTALHVVRQNAESLR